MIKYQLHITLYEKISLYSIRFDISLSLACCPGITEIPFEVAEMPNGKMQCPGIRCVILLQTFSENFMFTFYFYYLKIKTKHSFPVISIFYPSSGRDSIICHNPSFTIENF